MEIRANVFASIGDSLEGNSSKREAVAILELDQNCLALVGGGVGETIVG